MATRIAESSLLILLLLLAPEFAQRSGAGSQGPAVPDFAVLAKAADSFCDTMSALAKDLPSINTPGATAQAFDRWTKANEAYTNVFEALLTENQNYPKQGPSRGSAELAAAAKKIKTIKEDYPTLVPGMRNLLSRFRSDPDVENAVRRLQSSLDHLKKVMDSVSATLREGQ